MTDVEQIYALRVPRIEERGKVKAADTLGDLRRAGRETHTSPTEAQREAGNYKKGRLAWKGLTIAVENPKGSIRKGKDWQITMKDAYGYFVGTTSGADGDAVDVFVCEDHPDSEIVFVINQLKKDGKTHDEHKCVIGTYTEEEARKVYLRNYSPGWKGLGSVKAMALPDFKEWLATDPEKAASFEEENEKAKAKAQHSPLGHIRDGYVRCACGEKYHVMPDDGRCPKCGGTMHRVRGRTAKTAKLKTGFCQDPPTMVLVKRAADDTSDRPFTIAVDFDGTLAEDQHPFDPDTTGKPRAANIRWVRLFHSAGARIIIHTVRGDLGPVEAFLEENDVPYDHVNENPDQPDDSSDKLLADVYWDNRAVDATDADKTGPEVFRRLMKHNGEDGPEEQRVTVKITTVVFTAPELLSAMEAGHVDDTGGTGDEAQDDSAAGEE